MDGIHEDTGDCNMQCTEHPFKNNTPSGGICAICLQEKLGKLVSSSFPITVFPSSSSSSPSFRSDICSTTTTNTNTNTTNIVASVAGPSQLTNTTTQITQTNSTNCHHHQQYYSNRSRILYLIGQRKKKKKDHNIIIDRVHECINTTTTTTNNNMVFKRSKSTADGLRYTNVDNNENPHHNKRGFWSFIHLQKHSHATLSNKKTIKNMSSNVSSTSTSFQRKSNEVTIVVEDNEAPCQASFDRKVSRSRSVGCGSRSFSGDFFERISTGFGDCTLRRVESQRQQKSQLSVVNNNNSHDSIKERVRCGGLFSGFMVTSSSSSSSSSSYWVASNHPKESGVGNSNGVTGKVTSAVAGRERGWGWALESPIRAFSKQGSNKREGGSSKNQVPNINALPSLLSVRS